MGPRTLTTMVALGRLVLGAALVAAPQKAVGTGWVGAAEAARPTSSLLLRAVGARDVALALGTLAALRRGDTLTPWLVGGALADGVDFAATTTVAGSAVPPQARLAVGLLAGGGVAAQLVALRALD